MKNNGVPGDDNITAKLLKYGGDSVETMMVEILHVIWEQQKMPKSWTNDVLCPILKKFDKTNCNNYRGIMLLNTVFILNGYRRIPMWVQERQGNVLPDICAPNTTLISTSYLLILNKLSTMSVDRKSQRH